MLYLERLHCRLGEVAEGAERHSGRHGEEAARNEELLEPRHVAAGRCVGIIKTHAVRDGGALGNDVGTLRRGEEW